MINIDIKNLADYIEKAYKRLEEKKDFVEIPALKECERSMKRRIHNQGQDSDGNRIGIKGKYGGLYSPGYAKYKAKKQGAAIYPINLQLNGDLLKGYTVGRSQNKNVLDFQDDLSRKKAEHLEKTYKTELFKPSEQELEDVKEVWLLQFEDALRDSFS